MGDNVILAFFKELINRFLAKNPKFFNVVAWIGAVTAIISKLPEALALLNITLPASWQPLANDIWFWAGVVTVFISNLTVTKPALRASSTGKTDVNKFPFTARSEAISE